MNRQVLIGRDRSPNIREALSARTKDPLWFLARQWQTGEFEAENGGALIDIRVQSQSFAIHKMDVNGKTSEIKSADPLEALIEAEDSQGDALAWKEEALEYRFHLHGKAHSLRADDYNGFNLDWYQFDLDKAETVKADNVETNAFIPTQMSFPGAPDPKWWRMEQAEAYFDDVRDEAPNVASILLPEFFYTDINNWYLIPLPVMSGTLTHIESITVTDSFGTSTIVKSVSDPEWQVFQLHAENKTAAKNAKHLLYSPNIALDIVNNDPIEDVRFMRDEQSNLVWAWEHLFISKEGRRVLNGDGLTISQDSLMSEDNLPIFRLMSEIPSNWRPYVPRYIDSEDVTSGQIHLRRARTKQTSDPENPEFNSKLVSESKILNEEEIPKTGLRVRRIGRFARGSDGKAHFWTGRHKDAGKGMGRPELKFDYTANQKKTGG